MNAAGWDNVINNPRIDCQNLSTFHSSSSKAPEINLCLQEKLHVIVDLEDNPYKPKGKGVACYFTHVSVQTVQS